MKSVLRATGLAVSLLFATPYAVHASDERPVTQDQFKALIKVFKNVVDRFDGIEKRLKKTDGGEEEAVDLNAAGPGGSGAAGGKSFHTSKLVPNFKVYFDLNFVNRPGISDLSFDNFHSLLLFDLLPSADLQFSFDVNPTPRYYELDYQLAPWVQLRAGKIWIPFDDLAPHNIFGGRVNVSRLSLGAAFLPDLWTDLGVGAKFQIVDSQALSLTAHLYLVNGFRSGGTDPRNPTGGPEVYPSFSDLPSSADNNRDKAIGTRAHALIYKMLGLGASFYTGRWSSDSQSPARVNIFGLDGQFRFKNFEFRSGYAGMAVQLPSGSRFNRGGLYGEVGQKFGSQDEWKALVRAGKIQLDDRVIDVTDQTLVGATVLFKPGMIQYSIEHSRDLQDIAGKKNHSFTALRLVIAL